MGLEVPYLAFSATLCPFRCTVISGTSLAQTCKEAPDHTCLVGGLMSGCGFRGCIHVLWERSAMKPEKKASLGVGEGTEVAAGPSCV